MIDTTFEIPAVIVQASRELARALVHDLREPGGPLAGTPVDPAVLVDVFAFLAAHTYVTGFHHGHTAAVSLITSQLDERQTAALVNMPPPDPTIRN